MGKLRVYFVTLLVAGFLVGCQKELSIDALTQGPGGGGGSNASLIGTWKFLELSASTQSDVRVTVGPLTERAVTISDYTSINNKGSITFDAAKMTISGMEYDIDDELKVYLYTGNVLEDSISSPFAFSLPPYSAETNYKVIGSDSLYFESGSFGVPNATPQASQAGGGKFKINGDILTITMSSATTQTQNASGVTTVTNNKVTGTIKLQKN